MSKGTPLISSPAPSHIPFRSATKASSDIPKIHQQRYFSSLSPTRNENPGEEICRYYLNGTCYKGDACKYKHSKSPDLKPKEKTAIVKVEEIDRSIGTKSKQDVLEEVDAFLGYPGKKRILLMIDGPESKSKEFIIYDG